MAWVGDALVVRANYSLQHGLAPSQCDLVVSGAWDVTPDFPFRVRVSNSMWSGRLKDGKVRVSEAGCFTEIRAVDCLEDLWGTVVFGQVNMIDQQTGEVWTCIEGILDPSATYSGSGSPNGLAGLIGQVTVALPADVEAQRQALAAMLAEIQAEVVAQGGDPTAFTYANLMPLSVRSYDPSGWLLQRPRFGYMNAQDLVQWLAGLRGFRCSFSDGAQARMDVADYQTWQSARYNLYNLDWNAGQRIGAALTDVLDKLGLTVCLRMDEVRTLYIHIPGEQDVANIQWGNTLAADHTEGYAVQPVDTGVWVIGERNLYEFTQLPLIPDWNENWNALVWGPIADKMWQWAQALGMDESTIKVSDVARLDPTLAEIGAFGGRPNAKTHDQWGAKDRGGYRTLDGVRYSDMYVQDYVQKVVFHVYRIDGIQNVLWPDDTAAGWQIGEPPIVTPLISDPNYAYKVYARVLDESRATDKDYFQYPALPVLMVHGHRLLERTGQVLFEEPRYVYDRDISNVEKNDLRVEWIIKDAPLITCVFRGPAYRRFFGTPKRVGTMQVHGLRQAFVLSDNNADLRTQPEWVWDGDKSADDAAFDAATVYLDKPQMLASGKATFHGAAGHVPCGQVQRVTVHLGDPAGIVEEVDYSDDRPSAPFEPQIELRRKIQSAQAARWLARMESDRRDRARNQDFRNWLKDPTPRKTPREQMLDRMAAQAVRAQLYNPGNDPVSGGQPIVCKAVTTTSGVRAVEKVPIIQETSADKRAIAVALHDTGWTAGQTFGAVVISGIAKAWVYPTPAITQGDGLDYDPTHGPIKNTVQLYGCLVKGTGASGIVAAEDVAEGTGVVLARVKLGGGGGDGGDARTVVAAATTVIFGTFPPTGVGQSIDGYTVLDNDLILCKDQASVVNGVYEAHTGAVWTAYSELNPQEVFVVNGTANGGKLFVLVDSSYYGL
jgi:hypothetical protein